MNSGLPINDSDSNQATAGMILGEVASPGVARGAAMVYDCEEETAIARHVIDEGEVSQEIKDCSHKRNTHKEAEA